MNTTDDFFSLLFFNNKRSYARLLTEGEQECLGAFLGSACVKQQKINLSKGTRKTTEIEIHTPHSLQFFCPWTLLLNSKNVNHRHCFWRKTHYKSNQKYLQVLCDRTGYRVSFHQAAWVKESNSFGWSGCNVEFSKLPLPTPSKELMSVLWSFGGGGGGWFGFFL